MSVFLLHIVHVKRSFLKAIDFEGEKHKENYFTNYGMCF